MEPAENPAMAKVSGYLEKKGKKKMMSCYKKYWFVLEGRLLLYYKSKDEYDAISPCKGSIPLGPTCNVKPCTSNIGVFQIESKTTTITLRAETRDDQHKWMQAIMSALNPRNNSAKLSHFRYSLGELSPEPKKPLQRQNTLPERLNSPKTDNKGIIEKLQRMGAQTYGLGPIIQHQRNKTLSFNKKKSFSDESISSSGRPGRESRFKETAIIEHDENEKVRPRRRANSVESVDVSSEGIYERIPSNDSVFIRRENKESTENVTRQQSILVENTEYCSFKSHKGMVNADEDTIYTEPSEKYQKNTQRPSTIMIDNNQYWSLNKNSDTYNDHKYDVIDCNENNIKLNKRFSAFENFLKKKEHVNFEKVEGKHDENNIDYAEIPQYAEISPRNSSFSSEDSNEGLNEEKEKKRFKGFGKKCKSNKEKSEVKKPNIKKSESFLQRVWKKRSKNKKNKSKEISLSNDNILEKLDLSDDNTIQMLSALQEILESKKPVLKQTLQETVEYNEIIVEKSEDKTENPNVQCPLLPPRNHKQNALSPYHDIPTNNQPISKIRQKTKINMESLSLDDILNDLNKTEINAQEKENEESTYSNSKKLEEGKVKELIKRFNIDSEEVELRRKKYWKLKDGKTEVSITDSGELNRLLDELTKVTTAPIMTPGVTSSLINPDIPDEELIRMVPIRRRRLSDPDYDIPRPHRSLSNIPKKDDNALTATRFFGPILKASDFNSNDKNRPQTPTEYSNWPSITPDSLELDQPSKRTDLTHEEDRQVSYHSHDYLSYNKNSHNHVEFLVENSLYAAPRLLNKKRFDFSSGYQTKSSLDGHESNVYIDSLEP